MQAFLPKWIAYLCKQNTAIAQNLLNEAIDLIGNHDLLLENARAYYKIHPGLYEKYIFDNQNIMSFEKLILLGKEALENINIKYVVRSRIALELGYMTLHENGTINEDVEGYWVEGFRSDSRVVNYLRSFMECRDFSRWKEKLKEMNHKHIKQSMGNYYYGYDKSTDLKENTPDYNHKFLIAMLNGEYEFVKKLGMNHKDALGWIASYMKNGLATFLLFLYNGETLTDGIKIMLRKIVYSISFSTDEYRKGILRRITENDYELLWKGIIQSKVINPIPDEEIQSYLEWIENLIQRRVDSIMEGNHRKYYQECAEYIAALGEVLESRGIANGKQNLMLEYKQRYSRRRAFHEELRNCKMMDNKVYK